VAFTSAWPQRSDKARSLEAYVLPRVVDVLPGRGGRVIALLVGDYGPVACGQALARLDRRWDPSPPRADDPIELEAVVRAPTSGLVSRCWASVGEAVGPTRPLLSIASSEEVLVVARFARGALSRLRSGRPGLVAVVGSSREASPARIETIVEAPDRGGADRRVVDDGPVRVVLRLASAPLEALWPGRPAEVEV
jgi:multidrug resistance efflux pump